MKQNAIKLIQEERQRQIEKHGFDAQHDANHESGELNDAALCYAYAAARQARGENVVFRPLTPVPWPWEDSWWKPSENRVRNLVKAAALLAAEIERELNANSNH